jgi:hypothetical protein
MDLLAELAFRHASAQEYAEAGMKAMAERLRGRNARLEEAHKQREHARLERLAWEERILGALREAGKVKPKVLAERLGLRDTVFFNKTRRMRDDGRIVVVRERHNEVFYVVGEQA